MNANEIFFNPKEMFERAANLDPRVQIWLVLRVAKTNPEILKTSAFVEFARRNSDKLSSAASTSELIYIEDLINMINEIAHWDPLAQIWIIRQAIDQFPNIAASRAFYDFAMRDFDYLLALVKNNE